MSQNELLRWTLGSNTSKYKFIEFYSLLDLYMSSRILFILLSKGKYYYCKQIFCEAVFNKTHISCSQVLTKTRAKCVKKPEELVLVFSAGKMTTCSVEWRGKADLKAPPEHQAVLCSYKTLQWSMVTASLLWQSGRTAHLKLAWRNIQWPDGNQVIKMNLT